MPSPPELATAVAEPPPPPPPARKKKRSGNFRPQQARGLGGASGGKDKGQKAKAAAAAAVAAAAPPRTHREQPPTGDSSSRTDHHVGDQQRETISPHKHPLECPDKGAEAESAATEEVRNAQVTDNDNEDALPPPLPPAAASPSLPAALPLPAPRPPARATKKRTTSVRVGAAAASLASVAPPAAERVNDAAMPAAPHLPVPDGVGIAPPTPSPTNRSASTLLPPEFSPRPADSAAAATTTPTLSQYCSQFRAKRAKKHGRSGHQPSLTDGGNGNDNGNEAAQNAPAWAVRTDAATTATHPPPSQSQGPVVQIVNGEIVLQESSVVVAGGTTTAAAAGRFDGGNNDNDDEPVDVVEEEEHLAVVGASYTSFTGRRNAPQHWKVDETKRFYEALRQVGTDFHTMAAYFTHRTRKQLKRKYQRELVQNPHLIERALHPDAKKGIDISVFQVTQQDVEAVQREVGTQPSTAETTPANIGGDNDRGSDPTWADAGSPWDKRGVLATTTAADVIVADSDTAGHQEGTEDARNPVRRAGDAESAAEAASHATDVDPLLEPEEPAPAPVAGAAVALLPTAAAAAARTKGKRPKFRSARRKRPA